MLNWIESHTLAVVIIEVLLVCMLGVIGFLIKRKYFKDEKFESIGSGGHGGNAKVIGQNGIAYGGNAGKGGIGGKGGDGGNAEAKGDNSFAMGGEGGDAGQSNGKGGKGGRGPAEVLGLPNIKLPDGTFLWDIGKGGDGGSAINEERI
jgi:hypothetical protein